MLRLPNSLQAWDTPDFAAAFKAEVEALDPAALPLQQALAHGSMACGEGFNVMLLAASEAGDHLRLKAAIQFEGLVAGCNCADDPSPQDTHPEYCEVEIDIRRADAGARIRLLPG